MKTAKYIGNVSGFKTVSGIETDVRVYEVFPPINGSCYLLADSGRPFSSSFTPKVWCHPNEPIVKVIHLTWEGDSSHEEILKEDGYQIVGE